jgi:WD40 repeat protein
MNAEYSLGPFCNWFLPTSLDIWSSNDGQQVLFGYGARSSLCLANITNNKSIEMRDCLNVFNNNKSNISCTKFAKNGSKSRRTPYIFIGSSEGEAAVLECNSNQVIVQRAHLKDLDMPSKKVLSADWIETSDGLVVYYCIHSLILLWNINTGSIKKMMVGDNYHKKIAISCITISNCGKQKIAIG